MTGPHGYVLTPEDKAANLADLANELVGVGATVVHDPDDGAPYVVVYHHTTQEAAEAIRASGVMRCDEDGLFFSTEAHGQASGYGPAVVRLLVPLARLVLDDLFPGEAHLRYPLPRAGVSVDVSACLTTR